MQVHYHLRNFSHFITPLLCTLPEYYYYGSMWAGAFEGLMSGVYKEVGSFIVQK